MDMFSYRADFQSQSSVKVSYDKEHGDEAIATNVTMCHNSKSCQHLFDFSSLILFIFFDRNF